jgi:hypothetical protein
MGRSSDIQAEAGGPNLAGCERTAAALAGEPRRPGDGSIDYDFYKARAQRLRHEFIVDVKLSLARQALGGLLLLAQWIAAMSDGALETRAAMRDVVARNPSEERFRRLL